MGVLSFIKTFQDQDHFTEESQSRPDAKMQNWSNLCPLHYEIHAYGLHHWELTENLLYLKHLMWMH